MTRHGFTGQRAPLTRASYPAKVLLFGEHTLLRGSQGLAVPYADLSLRWVKSRPDERLLKFSDYLKQSELVDLIDTSRLEDDLLADWRLEGNVPIGYGLGSSGAVCAAIFDRYRRHDLEPQRLREVFRQMEAFFHGDSSGTDPLICFLQQPVHLRPGQAPEPTQLPDGWQQGFFLVDTGKSRKASTIIRRFLEKYERCAEEVQREWGQPTNRAIAALQAGDRKGLYELIQHIGIYQIRQFRSFVPPAFRGRWRGGDDYAMKICGAGGGGMLLGLARNRARVREAFGKDGLRWL